MHGSGIGAEGFGGGRSSGASGKGVGIGCWWWRGRQRPVDGEAGGSGRMEGIQHGAGGIGAGYGWRDREGSRWTVWGRAAGWRVGQPRIGFGVTFWLCVQVGLCCTMAQQKKEHGALAPSPNEVHGLGFFRRQHEFSQPKRIVVHISWRERLFP